MGVKTDKTQIDLPEPLYNLLNFLPKNIKDKAFNKIISAYVADNKENLSKICQSAVDSMLLFNVSQADLIILNKIAFKLGVMNVPVTIAENPEKEYTPFESSSEYRDVPKSMNAEDLCLEIEAGEDFADEFEYKEPKQEGKQGDSQIAPPKPINENIVREQEEEPRRERTQNDFKIER